MSYRELRKLTETMRSLGYCRTISMESFRNPNFELVADILYWLLQRHDPSTRIKDDIEHEGQRIKFLSSIAELMQVKFHIKLNCVRLYQADGRAAQELLKLASVLQNAMKLQRIAQEQQDVSAEDIRAFDAKGARDIAAQITSEGARLYDLLSQEATSAAKRDRVVSRHTDTAQVESHLNSLVRELVENTEQLSQAFTASQQDEESLQSKIEHKRTQLERTQKRVRSLENTRPAHQEEYERMETDLADHFVLYLQNYRNVEFLETEMQKFHELEERLWEEQESKLRFLREKLRREELNTLREHDALEQNSSKFPIGGTQGGAPARSIPGGPGGAPSSSQQQQPTIQQSSAAQRAAANAASDNYIRAQQEPNNQRPSRPPSGRRQRPGQGEGNGKRQPNVQGNLYGGGDAQEGSESSEENSSDTGDLEQGDDRDQEQAPQAQPQRGGGGGGKPSKPNEEESDEEESDDDDDDDDDDDASDASSDSDESEESDF